MCGGTYFECVYCKELYNFAMQCKCYEEDTHTVNLRVVE